jgi:hypothetical protein
MNVNEYRALFDRGAENTDVCRIAGIVDYGSESRVETSAAGSASVQQKAAPAIRPMTPKTFGPFGQTA